jgi:dihydroxyacetone kinase
MLAAAYDGVVDIGGAQVGDKTLVDTLAPACAAYQDAVAGGQSFAAALQAMNQAAEEGKESTRQLVAKIGRASRLGERSRGVLDAGATSCYLILNSLATSIGRRLDN